MFEADFEKRKKQRKRPATDASDNRKHDGRKHAPSSGSSGYIPYKYHDEDSSRKAIPSTSRSLSEDRHSRQPQTDHFRPVYLKNRGSTHTNEGAGRHRQDGRHRRGFESSKVNNTRNKTSTGGKHESRQERSGLPPFQEARAKTTDSEPAAKYRRFNARDVGETSSSGVTSTIRHELTQPAVAAGVEIVYTKDVLEAETWLRDHIVDCSAEAVGFDIEQKPQFVSKKDGGTENKTAVLQLGVETSCLVLHICHMSELPKSLKSILRDENILKIGSGIQRDASKLTKDRGLVCEGLVDTQDMASSFGLQKVGLKALAEHFLDIELDKIVALTNWESFPLTLRQIEYAGLDAWVGLKVYQEMKRQKSSINTKMHVSPVPHHNMINTLLARITKARRRKFR